MNTGRQEPRPWHPITAGMLSALLALSLGACSTGTEVATGQHDASREDLVSSSAADGVELSEEEQRVDGLLQDMKAEAEALYAQDVPFGIDDWGEGDGERTRLHAFCEALPKGAELHTHDTCGISTDDFIDLLATRSDVLIELGEGERQGFLYAKGAEGVPETAVSLTSALEGGQLSREELRGYLTAYTTGTTRSEARWDKFERLFSVTSGLTADDALLEDIYAAVFRSYCENNVSLVEIRQWVDTDDETNRSLLETIRSAYYRLKKEYPNFVVRIIATSGKSEGMPVETTLDSLRSAIRLSTQVLDESEPTDPKPFIIGLDLVNEEDTGRPLATYADFLTSDEVQGSDLLLFLHAGESLRTDNEEAADAYLLGTTRLGHGFNVYRYPKLMEALAEDDVAIEVCPMSNYRLGYVADLRLHPGRIYLDAGIPVVLCSDDAVFEESHALVDDFYSAILCWDLSLAEVKAICQNSILHSGLSQTEIDALMEAWETDWNGFIASWTA